LLLSFLSSHHAAADLGKFFISHCESTHWGSGDPSETVMVMIVIMIVNVIIIEIIMMVV